MKISFAELPDPIFFPNFMNLFGSLITGVYFWDGNDETATYLIDFDNFFDLILLDVTFYPLSTGKFELSINNWRWDR